MTTRMRSGAGSNAPPSWLPAVAKSGYTAKGIVYVLVGGLAFGAALGVGGSVGGSKNALAQVSAVPGSNIVLGVVALGLLGYTIYRGVQAVLDPAGHGTDAKGILKRVTYAVSGLLHLVLALYAGKIVLGSLSGSSQGGTGGGDEGTSDKTASLMDQPYGVWLVGGVGVIVLAFALRQLYRAYKAEFMKKYKSGEMTADARKVAKKTGRAGLASRGLVFLIMGSFFLRAAMQHDPSESKGLGGALHSLLEQPYGRWLLGIVAAGLAAYGVFCFTYVKYRDFQRT